MDTVRCYFSIKIKKPFFICSGFLTLCSRKANMIRSYTVDHLHKNNANLHYLSVEAILLWFFAAELRDRLLLLRNFPKDTNQLRLSSISSPYIYLFIFALLFWKLPNIYVLFFNKGTQCSFAYFIRFANNFLLKNKKFILKWGIVWRNDKMQIKC